MIFRRPSGGIQKTVQSHWIRCFSIQIYTIKIRSWPCKYFLKISKLKPPLELSGAGGQHSKMITEQKNHRSAKHNIRLSKLFWSWKNEKWQCLSDVCTKCKESVYYPQSSKRVNHDFWMLGFITGPAREGIRSSSNGNVNKNSVRRVAYLKL